MCSVGGVGIAAKRDTRVPLSEGTAYFASGVQAMEGMLALDSSSDASSRPAPAFPASGSVATSDNNDPHGEQLDFNDIEMESEGEPDDGDEEAETQDLARVLESERKAAEPKSLSKSKSKGKGAGSGSDYEPEPDHSDKEDEDEPLPVFKPKKKKKTSTRGRKKKYAIGSDTSDEEFGPNNRKVNTSWKT